MSRSYKGKPTHHLCAKDPASGNMLVNKKDMAKSPDIVQVVKKLAGSTLPAGWPIKLTKACNTDGSSGPPSFVSTAGLGPCAAGPLAVQRSTDVQWLACLPGRSPPLEPSAPAPWQERKYGRGFYKNASTAVASIAAVAAMARSGGQMNCPCMH